MTLQELYGEIGGDYEQAMRVLRVEKLVDKHIRKFTGNGVVEALLEAVRDMDGERMFETGHAVKGVTANLGLRSLSEAASRITEEFRPGNTRSLSDEEITGIACEIEELYRKTADGIRRYAEG